MTSTFRSPMLVLTALAAAACSPDDAGLVEPGEPGAAVAQVQLCHFSDGGGRPIEVAAAALGAHRGHGDYVTRMLVSPSATPGDGFHFRRIGDALAAAREARVAHGERTAGACRITIEVAAGSWAAAYGGGPGPDADILPLVVDVPDITLRGAYQPVIDAGGRATAQGQTAAVTIIAPEPALATVGQFSQPILMIDGRSDGYAGHRTVVEGFAFRSGNVEGDPAGGAAIVSLRVNDVAVRNNRFEGGFSESVDLRAGSGSVERNHLAGGGGTCDICLAGPGRYHAEGNRLLAGGIPGILIVPAILLPVPAGIEQYELPASSEVAAIVVNNEVRNHQRVPVGTGLRVGAVGVGAPNVAGKARVEARDNLIANNRFAMLVEAAFPVANTLRRGDIEVRLSGNEFLSSCQAPLLVSFSRHTTALGLSNNPYLLGSTYVIDLGGDLTWDEAWFGHPDGFDNVLVVDGVTMANGTSHQYDAAKVCS